MYSGGLMRGSVRRVIASDDEAKMVASYHHAFQRLPHFLEPIYGFDDAFGSIFAVSPEALRNDIAVRIENSVTLCSPRPRSRLSYL
jgi:hypothetical protein